MEIGEQVGGEGQVTGKNVRERQVDSSFYSVMKSGEVQQCSEECLTDCDH